MILNSKKSFIKAVNNNNNNNNYDNEHSSHCEQSILNINLIIIEKFTISLPILMKFPKVSRTKLYDCDLIVHENCQQS